MGMIKITRDSKEAINEFFNRAVDETNSIESVFKADDKLQTYADTLLANFKKYGYPSAIEKIEKCDLNNTVVVKFNNEGLKVLGYEADDWILEVPEKAIPLDPIKYPMQKMREHKNINAPATIFQVPETPTETVPSEMKSATSHVEIDPNTGMNKIVSKEHATQGQADVGLADIESTPEFSINEHGEKFLKERFKDEDILEVINFVKDYKAGNTTNVWGRMPKCMKVKLGMGSGFLSTKIADLNYMANAFMDELINDIQLEQEFIDVETALQKEFNNLGDGIGEITSNFSATKFTELLKATEERKDEDPEGYEKVKKMYEAYIDATTFKSLKEAAASGKYKRLDKLIKRYDRECDNFNYKYTSNKVHNYGITNVKAMGLALKRALPGDKYTEDDVMKFVLLFLRYTLNYKSENVFEHVFMYYTIKQVCLLDAFSKDHNTFKEIYNNVVEIIDTLKK